MDLCKALFSAGVDAVQPHLLMKQALRVIKNEKGDLLQTVTGRTFALKGQNVHVAAFGKAALGMCRGLPDELAAHISNAVASIPIGSIELTRKKWPSMMPSSELFDLREGARDNLPDEAAMNSALKIKQLVMNRMSSDIVLILVSGGGSALLPLPAEGLTLEEKVSTIRLVAGRGATINELNTVRQQLSQLKQGQLAALAKPAQVIGLIFSDIVGNPLSLIASGPTVASDTTTREAMQILSKYHLDKEVPSSVVRFLEKSSPKKLDLSHVHNILIGDNSVALSAACRKAEELGLMPLILSITVHGEARKVGAAYASLAHHILEHISGVQSSTSEAIAQICTDASMLDELMMLSSKAYLNKGALCVLCGGETTVDLQHSKGGQGGRNQELALSFLVESWRSHLSDRLADAGAKICFMSAGTDGWDGPTDAAGAFVTNEGLADSRDTAAAENFLREHNSYEFFSKFCEGRLLFKSGLTGTNVMDMHVLFIEF